MPRSSGIVGASPSKCSRTETPLPCGCSPCDTCASWSGSPSRIRFRAEVAIARASASETCPASSIDKIVKGAIELMTREEPGRAGEKLNAISPPRQCAANCGSLLMKSPSYTDSGLSRSTSSSHGSLSRFRAQTSRSHLTGYGSPYGFAPPLRLVCRSRADARSDRAPAHVLPAPGGPWMKR